MNYGNPELYVIIDNRGQELFRFYDSIGFYRRAEITKDKYYYDKTYKNHYVITDVHTPLILYDNDRGFGVFEFGDYKTENFNILWTGIRLPDYCVSFDVEPSNNNQTANVLDLYSIAKKY